MTIIVKGVHWVPDYTLRATADTTYLKVRKNTYLVAVKTSRMESSTNYPSWKEEELEEVLVKITENDADFCQEGSEQKMERRESILSTISIIKSRLGTRSNSSFHNIREERSWEILGGRQEREHSVS